MRRWHPLVEVLDEFNAIDAALRRVEDLGLIGDLGSTARTFGRARQRLEATYLVRLVSAFEGILRAEYGTNEEGLFSLIELAILRSGIAREKADAAHEIRRQRNWLVHPSTSVQLSRVPLSVAFRTLQTFVNRL